VRFDDITEGLLNMTESLIQHEIDRLLDSLDGDVTTRSRAVNGFLDLRLAGASNDLFVLAVDDALANMPGRTAVPNAWLMTTLHDLRGALGNGSPDVTPATTA